ncbi:MAG: YceI family protein [Cyclobacteriaceae bacterium]
MKGVNSLLVIGLAVVFGCDYSTNRSSQKEVQYLPETGTTNHYSLVGNDYLIDDQHSYLGFRIKYFGYSPVRGRFDEFEGTVFYDENNISSLSVSVAIDVNSINTGNSTRDEDLLKFDTWFDAPKYPNIQFVSKRVIVRADGGFDLIGDVTIKGTTKEINVPFEPLTGISLDYGGEEQIDYSGRFTLDRQEFGIFGGDFWSSIMEDGLTQLSDAVEIEIDIHTRRPDYLKRFLDYDSANIRAIVLNMIKEKGIEEGLEHLDKVLSKEEITSGALSSIGNTLNEWGMHNEAARIFEKKLTQFPNLTSTHSQLAITMLHQRNRSLAKEQFEQVLLRDSTNTRAIEYLKLLAKLKSDS